MGFTFLCADTRARALAAVARFRAANGRFWKARLRQCWENATYRGIAPEDASLLQWARNALGPTWLHNLRPSGLPTKK
jgi:hypothetical protein